MAAWLNTRPEVPSSRQLVVASTLAAPRLSTHSRSSAGFREASVATRPDWYTCNVDGHPVRAAQHARIAQRVVTDVSHVIIPEARHRQHLVGQRSKHNRRVCDAKARRRFSPTGALSNVQGSLPACWQAVNSILAISMLSRLVSALSLQ